MQKPFVWIAVTCMVLLAVYVGLCCHVISGRAPLDFADDVAAAPRSAIQTWYDQPEQSMGRAPLDAQALVYALLHPYRPHRLRPSVSNGGLAGEGSVQISYVRTVAVFVDVDGGWRLAFLVDG